MKENLEDLLVKSGLVTESQLAAAHLDAARTRKRLPETLIDLGFIDERRFAEWIAQVSRTPLVDPLSEESAAAIQHKISRAIGRELEVIPVRLDEDTLSVAMVNPVDRNALDVLAATSGLKVRAMTGVRSAIERLIKRFYPDDYGAPDITVLPAAGFELVSGRDTLPPVPGAEPEVDFSDLTLINTARGLALAERTSPRTPAAKEFGTLIAPAQTAPRETEPAPAAPKPDESTNPTTPLVAIERRLDQLARMIVKMQKQLDNIDAILRHNVQR